MLPCDQEQELSFETQDLAGQQAGGGITQNMAGLTMPLAFWDTKFTKFMWQLKWTVNGLTPIRPVVVWNIDFSLDAQKCLVISN